MSGSLEFFPSKSTQPHHHLRGCIQLCCIVNNIFDSLIIICHADRTCLHDPSDQTNTMQQCNSNPNPNPNSFSSTAYTTHSHSQLGYRTGASRGSEHVHHGAPSFLSWRGIVFDKAHSVVLSSTRMTHGVEGLITPSSAETHTH